MVNGLVRNPMPRMISGFGRSGDYLRGKHAARPLADCRFAIGVAPAARAEKPSSPRNGFAVVAGGHAGKFTQPA
jgi:hypothetical protein